MLDVKKAIHAALRYGQKNPRMLVRAARNAAALELTIPLEVARRAVMLRVSGRSSPRDVTFAEEDRALRVGATLSIMATPVRASCALRVDGVTIGPDAIDVVVRVAGVSIAVDGESDSPLASLLRTGALDLSQPGNLVRYMPKRPAIVREAGADRLVLDLLALPALGAHRRFRRALSIAAPLLAVRSVRVERDAVVVGLRPKFGGLVAVFRALAST